MKRSVLTIFAAALLACAGASSHSAWAQQADFANTQIRSQDLGHGIYELVGKGGNITVATGDNGIMMVDTEFAPLHAKIKAAIDALSKQPIKYIVNTHFHGDHTGGDAAFLREGATVVAQENVVKRLVAGTTNGLTGNRTAGLPPDAVPNKTYRSGTLSLKVKGVTAVVGHVANAHTVALLTKRGMSEDQAIAVAPFADTDLDAAAQATWVRMVYRSLRPKKTS